MGSGWRRVWPMDLRRAPRRWAGRVGIGAGRSGGCLAPGWAARGPMMAVRPGWQRWARSPERSSPPRRRWRAGGSGRWHAIDPRAIEATRARGPRARPAAPAGPPPEPRPGSPRAHGSPPARQSASNRRQTASMWRASSNVQMTRVEFGSLVHRISPRPAVVGPFD